jgi:HEAT repeat protein
MSVDDRPQDKPQRYDRFRVAMVVLAGLALFLMTSIGAVLLARAMRPWIFEHRRPSGRAVKEAIKQLQVGQNTDQRREAARAIVAAGPEAVAKTLAGIASLSRDGDAEKFYIQLRAARDLAGVGSEAAGPLGKALSSVDPHVRAAAASILRDMGADSAAAVPALSAALGDENRWVRWFAIEALGYQGPGAEGAAAALLPLIDHPDATMRRRAIDSLGRLGPAARAAEGPLTKASEQDSDKTVQASAKVALYQLKLDETASGTFKQTTGEVRALIERLQGADEAAAAKAATVLGSMGVQARDSVPALALALRHKSKGVRAAAAGALGGLGLYSIDVLPSLQAAAKEADPDVRLAAEKAVEQIEGRGAR